MGDIGKDIGAGIAAIIGLAVLAIVISSRANTVAVLQSFFAGASNLIGVAISPITGQSVSGLTAGGLSGGAWSGSGTSGLLGNASSIFNMIPGASGSSSIIPGGLSPTSLGLGSITGGLGGIGGGGTFGL
jgi:membrane DNA delivery protein